MGRYRVHLHYLDVEGIDEDDATAEAVSEVLMGNFDIEEVIALDEEDIWD